MEKSMVLLKQEHKSKLLELTDLLNKLKKQLIQKDIYDYCKKTNFNGTESHIYGTKIANEVYANANEATGGDICLFVEDRRKEAFLWLFEVEFDAEIYQAPYIITKKLNYSPDDIICVEYINDRNEDETIKAFVQEAIEKLDNSIGLIKKMNATTVEYSYFCDSPRTDKIKGFSNVVDQVLRYHR